jgi:hypothetical protein
MCIEVFSLNSTKSSEDEDINLNKAAVSGIMGIGGGFYNLEEFLATVEIPFMTAKTYQKHNKIFNYPTSTRRHGNFAGVHTLLRILLSSNSAVLINIITGVLPPHFDFVVYYVLCQC